MGSSEGRGVNALFFGCGTNKKAGTQPAFFFTAGDYFAGAGGGGVSGLLSLTDAGSVVFRFATALFTFFLVFLAAFFVLAAALCSAALAFSVIVGCSDDVVVPLVVVPLVVLPLVVVSAANTEAQERARLPANTAAMTDFT